MLRPTFRFAAPVVVTTIAGALLLFACHDTGMEPESDFASINARYSLTIVGTGSVARGVVTSDRGGLSCTIAAGGAASGKCKQSYRSGAIVTLYLAPSAGARVGSLTNCTPSNENQLACDVVMTQNWTVTINFANQSNTATLTVSGGASGSGGVTSAPQGVSCSISSGTAATTGCTAAFALNTSVTLTATASTGSYLKAWAGGGCDVSGTGVGGAGGTCTVSMSAARAIVVSFDRPTNAALYGEWGAPFTWDVVAIHTSVLPNGKVMSWGRSDGLPLLWDPPTNTFMSTSRPVDFFCSGHSLLPDGRLFIAGGHGGADHLGIRASVIYNAVTNTWSTGPTMRNGRWYPTVTALPNGEMLTVSGGDTAKLVNQLPEVYTTGNTWRALTSAQVNIPYYPMMFVLPNGKVFVAGPSQGTGFFTTDGTGSWANGPASAFGFRGSGSAVMYEPGKIMIVGGGTPTNTAEMIDLNVAGATWQPAGNMRVARVHLTASLLPDGTVLATGGTNATGFNNKPTDDNVLAAERWDPSTKVWTPLARQSHYRVYHSTALLLPDARVLSVGSGQPFATGLFNDYTGEIYTPPYLFDVNGNLAPRPAITTAPTSVSYGQTFAVETPSASSITKVTWIRLPSVTHAFNMNQRINVLSFSMTGASTLSVTSPANANLAPPGHYMLFLLNASGVPSVAKIVRISAGGGV